MTKKIVSILLLLTLAVSLFSGSALAAAGDANGTFIDFISVALTGGPRIQVLSRGSTGVSVQSSGGYLRIYIVFPSTVKSGSFVWGQGISSNLGTYNFSFFDSDAHWMSQVTDVPYSTSVTVPDNTRFIQLWRSTSSSYTYYPDRVTYSNFEYYSSSSDATIDEVLQGIEAIAQSLYDLETGPYSSTSGVNLNSDGVLTPTTRNDATLETLLNLIGVSSTYSSLAIEQMNLNFGNYFEYHEIEDTSSGTVTVVKNLPSYVNALGMELTDGINKLQRDNLLLYQQSENIEDALYTDKSENQPWSVAQWLKDIYIAITSFFSSFWSPAETDLKTAAEDGMQAAADNGNAASGSQVDEVNSAADAFKSFGSTGNIGSGDVMDIFSDGASYDFFSQTTKDNLAYHPPAGSQRLLRSSSAPPQSDQNEEEYVDELDDKLSYWREVLGLP